MESAGSVYLLVGGMLVLTLLYTIFAGNSGVMHTVQLQAGMIYLALFGSTALVDVFEAPMEQSEDSGSATEQDCKAAVRRHGVAIGNEEIQHESCRSEESQVDHARLQLDRVHDARVAGENRVQQGQHQHATNKEIYGD